MGAGVIRGMAWAFATLSLGAYVVIGAGSAGAVSADPAPIPAAAGLKPPTRQPPPVVVRTPAVTFTGVDWAPPKFPKFRPVTVTTPKVTFTGVDWAPPKFPKFRPVTVTTPKVSFTGIGGSAPGKKPADERPRYLPREGD